MAHYHRSRYLPRVLACIVATACTSSDLMGEIKLADLEFADPVLQTCVLDAAVRNEWRLSGQISHIECTNSQSEKIKKLDGIEALINLQSLDLSHNAISDPILLDELRHLERLDLDNNEIQSVRLRRLHETLRALSLNNNKITDVTWLATYYRLEHLSLSHNRLRLIPAIVGLDSLRSLDLSYNDIVDVTPLKRLTHVETINVKNSPLDCSALEESVSILPQGVDIFTDCELSNKTEPRD